MKNLRAPTQEQAGALIGMAAVLFGGWVRLLIPQMAGFPVNDGGLFYVMLQAVQTNGLRIPQAVQYNGLNIPFAYPPLGFLVGAWLANVFRVDAIKVLQWLPAVVLVGTLPAIYFLAKSVLGSSWKAGLATLMYAFTPRAITWQIMGGGLTRGFGQLFLILAAACIYLTFAGYSRKRLALSILFSSLVVLSHPEAALQTVGIAILFWIFRGRSKDGVLHAAMIGAGTLIITAVWWLPVIVRFGIGTLLSAGQTGLHDALALLQPFLLNFVDEPLMTLVAVFGLVGFAVQAAKRQWLIPIWFFLPFLVEPRSAPTVAMVPLGLLAGVALSDVILPAIVGFEVGTRAEPGQNVLRGKAAPIFLLFIGLYMLGGTAYFGAQVAGTRLSQGDREAFNWIKDNTPTGSRFVVMTGNTEAELFCDAPLEWFPALTQRTSLTTIQGREWQDGKDFGAIAGQAQNVAGCLSAEAPLDCVNGLTTAQGGGLRFDYVYVARKTPILSACRATGTSMRGEMLLAQLKAAPGYSEAFETEAAAVFRREAP